MSYEIEYRAAETTDTESFWNMMNQLDNETKFMMYEPGERTKNLAKLQGVIDSAVEGSNLLYMALDKNNIIGYISVQRGSARRELHSAYIVVGIREPYQHQGIGTEFFKKLDEWAHQNRIVRLELTVMRPNIAAFNLYQKNGFEVEGIKKKSMYIDGEYIDEYYMSKILS